MGKRSKKIKQESAVQTTPRVQAFSFGDINAEIRPVTDMSSFINYLECGTVNGLWYEVPMSFEYLARVFRAAAHHGSALFVKRNILSSTFQPHPLLSRHDFSRFVLDYLVFGNAYFELRNNRLGEPLILKPALAKYTRRGVDLDQYYFLQYDEFNCGEYYTFPKGAVFQLMEPDINQEIYGLPEYLCGLNSILLNEQATLFRCKYYKNGAHIGSVFYLTDSTQNQTDVDNLREAISGAKGPGNFKNLFLHAPNGQKDGLQIIPLSEATAKDEFLNVKNTSRDDELATHRVPPQLMGIIPNNTGGFGSVTDASTVFVRNELVPLQERMKEINDWLGIEVIQFAPYDLGLDGDKNNGSKK